MTLPFIPLKPLYDRLLVKQCEADAKKGILFVPEVAKTRPSEGLVVAIGEGRVLANGMIKPIGVQVGEQVYFRRNAGEELEVEGETYLLLRMDDLLALVVPKPVVAEEVPVVVVEQPS